MTSMKNSRLVSLTAAAALSAGALTALIVPAAIAQAQPNETFMCSFNGASYEPGTKATYWDGTAMMCQKDGTWKYIGPGRNSPA
jgi:hypothetical protein